MSKSAAVTEREAAYLEHRRRAAAQGLPLSEYCRRNDLRVNEWYQVQRSQARKQAVSRTVGEDATAGSFAAVRVSSSAMQSAAAMPMGCRIRHPSGWTIECATLPPASWVNALASTVDR